MNQDLNETVRESVIVPPKLSDETSKKVSQYSKWAFIMLFLVIFFSIILLLLFLPTPPQFQLSTSRIYKHLDEFEKITREFGTRNTLMGHAKSFEYIFQYISQKKLNTTRSFFQIPFHVQNSEPKLSFVNPDYEIVKFKQLPFGNGRVEMTKKIEMVQSGCKEGDYENAKEKVVFLKVYSNQCSLVSKLTLAQNAGAVGMVLLNVFDRHFEEFSDLIKIPVFSLNNDDVLETFIKNSPSIEIRIQSDVATTSRSFYNLVVQVNANSDNATKALGIGADVTSSFMSINHDMTTVSLLMEILTSLDKMKSIGWNLRFIFWSFKPWSAPIYLRNRLDHYLHLESLGSQNGIYTVSASLLEPLISKYMNATSIPYQLGPQGLFYSVPSTSFTTNPSNNLKTPDEVENFGGISNAPYDPCYLKPCDNVLNVQKGIFEVSIATIWNLINSL